MPTHRQVRDAIAATLNAVPNIGSVQTFERFSKQLGDLKGFYVSAGQLRGWLIRRLRERRVQIAIGRDRVDADWQLRGYLSIDDSAESELVFDDLIDAAIVQFRLDVTLGGVINTTVLSDRVGLQLEASGPVMFAGVLCHEARLALTTRHFE